MDLSFYRGRRVLVTGHTGFKGSWLCRILVNAGAEVLGYSTCRERSPSLFARSGLEGRISHVQGDVRNYPWLLAVFRSFQPEVVFHLAAQPIVRESYAAPLATYETNVMGTVNLLEAIRETESVKSALVITTDKVYRNNEWPWGYRENDVLDGYDPYSNSKSCAELVTASYRRSFLEARGIPVSTARAGNVLGGGDFAKDRIIPDCVRAAAKGEKIVVRNPRSVRPFQHVLEPLFAYLLIAMRQEEDPSLAGSCNVGPADRDCLTAGDLVTLFCDTWGEGMDWIDGSDPAAPHEAGFLKLDCSRIKAVFGWEPRWHIQDCIRETVRFSKLWLSGGDIPGEMDREIREYLS
jgi:CDP-glucose 4,6-dehydratase